MKIDVLNKENNIDVLKLVHIISHNICENKIINIYMNQETKNVVFASGWMFEWKYVPNSTDEFTAGYMGNSLYINNDLAFGEVILKEISTYIRYVI